MKKLIKSTFFLFLLLGFQFVNGQSVRDVGSFSMLKASSSVKVKLIKSNQHKVEFKMVNGNEEDLITEVNEDKLIVKIKNGRGWGSNAKAAVKVYYTTLSSVDASAGASVEAEEPIMSDDMEVDASSGASIDVEVKASTIGADVSSGAKIRLRGNAKSGNYDVSSGANLNAKLMICDNVDADVSSGGKMSIHVDKKLNADASSGGTIRYKGNVKNVDTDSGRSGQIKRMN